MLRSGGNLAVARFLWCSLRHTHGTHGTHGGVFLMSHGYRLVREGLYPTVGCRTMVGRVWQTFRYRVFAA